MSSDGTGRFQVQILYEHIFIVNYHLWLVSSALWSEEEKCRLTLCWAAFSQLVLKYYSDSFLIT
jgi:hypothetical protein